MTVLTRKLNPLLSKGFRPILSPKVENNSGAPTPSPAQFTMQAQRKTFQTSQGLEISYLEWKPSAKTSPMKLLALHGMADHALVWDSLGASLGEQFHIIAPDLRGHGESSKPNGQQQGYGFKDSIADLNELMAHLGWPAAHIMGHSWTGKMIAVWARQQPERFHSLLLIDPAFINSLPSWTKITFPLFYRILPFLKMLGPFESKAAAEAQARQLKQYADWTPLQQQVFEAAVEEKADGQWGSKFTIAAREPMFTDVMRVPGFTQAIDLPTLMVQPTGGINRSEGQLKPYRKYLSNLEVCTMETTHWPFLSMPEEFETAIAHFLHQQSP